jgi:hypothetical protein
MLFWNTENPTHAMMSGDMEAAKKAILKAKEHIDAAAAHEETKASQKTLFNKGEIYYSFLSIGNDDTRYQFYKARWCRSFCYSG